MKRILCIVLAALMLLSVCGCTASGKAFTAGEVNGSVYTNEFAELTFTAPADWTYSTEEELAQLMNVSLDIVTDENEYAKKIAELTTVYGMMATSADSGSNVQVMFENLAITGNKSIKEEDYVVAVTSMLQSTYENMGVTCTLGDTETVKIGENEYKTFSADIDYMGSVMEQTYIFRKVDKYMLNIIITSATNDTDELLGLFS